MVKAIFDPLKPEFIAVEGYRLRMLQSPGLGLPILITAPWPQSIYAFHAIWHDLLQLGPIIAVDLPGFGRSDHRSEMMSPEAMGQFVIRLAAELGLARFHAVGPDVGTSAMLFAAAARPELFESLVVGSGGVDGT